MNILATIFFFTMTAMWILFSLFLVSRIRDVRYKGDASGTALTFYFATGTVVIVVATIFLL